jgi:hypothetical protein
LHPSVIDNVGVLYELFSRVGKLANYIRVISNPKPAETAGGPPLCSAYVNYFTVEDGMSVNLQLCSSLDVHS